MALQESPLQTDAKIFIERHGFQLPSVYSNFPHEYLAATTQVGIHDASYMGRLKATGEDSLDLLNRMSTNQVLNLSPGEGTVTVLTTDRGRIIDVLGVVNQGEHVILLTSPGRQQTVIDWLDKYTIMEDLVIEDASLEMTMIALVGPKANILLGLNDIKQTSSKDALSIQSIEIGGFNVQALNQPMGELSRYWLITEPESANAVWQHLTDAGAIPVGATAMDAVRVNFGIPEFGSELGEPFNPLEAGLIGSVDFTKGCYIGQEVIARLDSYKKIQKFLVSLAFDPETVVSPGNELLLDGQPIGTVTSVAPEATDGVLKGLGYVKSAVAIPGTTLELEGSEIGLANILTFAQPYGPSKD